MSGDSLQISHVFMLVLLHYISTFLDYGEIIFTVVIGVKN